MDERLKKYQTTLVDRTAWYLLATVILLLTVGAVLISLMTFKQDNNWNEVS